MVLGPDFRKMAFGRNRKGPCGKRAKMVIGRNGKVGEMASWRNEKWSKMKLGKTAKGQDRYWGRMGKGRSWKGRKMNGRNGKNSGEMGMGDIGLGELGINRTAPTPRDLGLTHYQTTNFRLFQTERVCRRQFQI